MEFEYYNPSEEKRSCVVRTMTKLTDKKYSTVKTELTALAREIGCESYNDEKVFDKYMENHSFYKWKCYNDTKVCQLELSCGIYCVYCTNRDNFYHLLPVVDNVIYDRRDDSRELYVIAVYKKEV
jgi:hypothetical protein